MPFSRYEARLMAEEKLDEIAHEVAAWCIQRMTGNWETKEDFDIEVLETLEQINYLDFSFSLTEQIIEDHFSETLNKEPHE